MSASRILTIGVVLVLVAVGFLGFTGCGEDQQASGTESTGPVGAAVTTGTTLDGMTATTAAADGPDLYPAPVEGTWGYIDATGAWVIEPQFGYALGFSQGLAPARPYNDWRWGYIDATGAWVIEPEFGDARPFSDGLARIKSDAGYGFVDTTGTVVIQPQFDLAADFSEGLAVVSWLVPGQSQVPPSGPGGVMGTVLLQYVPYSYIDTTGKLVIEGAFDSAAPFSGGLAAVRADGGAGYIDTTGAWVIQPRFDGAYAFHGDLAFVCLDIWTDSWAYIDKTGSVVWESGPGAYESHETGASSTTTLAPPAT